MTSTQSTVPPAATADEDFGFERLIPDDGGMVAALRRALHLALMRAKTPHLGRERDERDEWFALAGLVEGERSARGMAVINRALAEIEADHGPTPDGLVFSYRDDMGEADLRAWAAQAAEVIDLETWRAAAEGRDHRRRPARIMRRALKERRVAWAKAA